MERSEWSMDGSDGLHPCVPELDREEWRLGALVNDLNRAIACGNEANIPRLMNQLLVDACRHFAHEEQFMSEAAYPRLKGHAALHDQIRAEMEHAMKQLRHTRLHALRNEYGLLVEQLVTEHATQERKKFQAFLQSKSSPNS